MIAPHERRWRELPETEEDLASALRVMRERGDITPIASFRNLYEVTAPYARQGFLDEREILFELNPYAALTHLSALVYHGLTEQEPKDLTATASADLYGEQLPLGTRPADWEGIPVPRALRPQSILGRRVNWLKVTPNRFFGLAEYETLGFPMRYTTPERTLIDGLQDPERCGGITNVLRAWVLARDIINLDILAHQVERYDVAVLRQRVGYVLDQIGVTLPGIERWRSTAHRGSSSRLVASQPFSPTFDARWNLSINAPVDVLRESRT